MKDRSLEGKVGLLEYEFAMEPGEKCDGCEELSQVRVGTKHEWLLHLCAICANAVGMKIARFGREIRDAERGRS